MTKVLLVEDDNNLREIYEARLAAEGYDIVTAKDGEEALEVAKQHRPELIISDVMMPRISGFEMLDILRTTNGLKDAKVIMLTALGQAEDRARADHLGADRYLVKSQVTLEDIVNAASELLNGVEAPVDASEVTPAAFAPEPVAPPPAAPAAPATPAVDHAVPSLTIVDPSQQPAVMPSEPVFAPVEPLPTMVAPAAPEPVYAQPTMVEPAPSAPVEPLPTMVAPAAPEPVYAQPTMVEPAPAPVVDTPLPMPTIPSPDNPIPDPVVPIVSPTPPMDPLTSVQDTPVAPPSDTVSIEPDQSVTATDGGDIPVIELPELDVKPEAFMPEDTENPVILQMPTNPDTDIVNGAQTATDEEAAIEQQIEQFIHTDSVMPQGINPVPAPEFEPAETSPAEESANASIINSAVEQLVGEEKVEPPVPAPAPATTETADDPSNSSQISGKKMIQPMMAPENKADLATLVAQEEMAANIEKGITGNPVIADVNASAPATPPLAITTDAPTPGGVFSPNSDGTAQSNAL